MNMTVVSGKTNNGGALTNMIPNEGARRRNVEVHFRNSRLVGRRLHVGSFLMPGDFQRVRDRNSTRLNSRLMRISYAILSLKKNLYLLSHTHITTLPLHYT